jgi:kynurenine formamidase
MEPVTVTPSSVLGALRLARTGQVYDLDPGRFAGMPLWPGHPPFQIMTYRSPAGIRAQGDQEWLDERHNRVGLHFVSDLMITGLHSGAHMDALGHITCGAGDHGHGGVPASARVGDLGLLDGDASELPMIISRGVLLDMARHLGHGRLPKGYAISREEFDAALKAQGTRLQKGDAVLIRTGQMGAWLDPAAWEATRGSGITLEVAERILECEPAMIGADNEGVEVMPSVIEDNPHPVHMRVLIEAGVHLVENMNLEALAADGVHEFLFIALPPKISGATGSFVRPVAVV